MSGRIGETRFVSLEQKLDDWRRSVAISGVFENDVLEWYRQQYNIQLSDDKYLHIDEDIAYVDFYRRQYHAEINFGLRKWGDMSPGFLMPPFPLLKQFGGALPSPNGFGYTDEDTIDNEKLTGKKDDDEDEEDAEEFFEKFDKKTPKKKDDFIDTPKHTNPDVPAYLKDEIVKPPSGMIKTETQEVGMSDEDFWKWVEADEKGEAETWEVIDKSDGEE